MNIILCGFKNCGKSTLGKVFSACYGSNFIDTDDLIISKYSELNNVSYSLQQIVQAIGFDKFRELEAEVIQSLNNIDNTIIATGGGAVLDKASLSHLKKLGAIIYLNIAPDVLQQRLLQSDILPLFIRKTHLNEDLNQHIDERTPIYEAAVQHPF